MTHNTHNLLLMKNPLEVLGNCYVELKTVIKSCNYLIATMNEKTSKIVIDPHLGDSLQITNGQKMLHFSWV